MESTGGIFVNYIHYSLALLPCLARSLWHC
jgi:hypothetical protein